MPLFARLKALGASPAFTRLVAGAWGLSLLLGLLVPVYSDEVGWRLQERAGLDGVDKLYSEPVSYTHLDVYKRQLSHPPRPPP